MHGQQQAVALGAFGFSLIEELLRWSLGLDKARQPIPSSATRLATWHRILVGSSLVLTLGCSEANESPGAEPDAGAELDASDIPAERLDADATSDCPGAFATGPLVAGQNTGFMSAGQSRDFWLILPDAGEGPHPLLFVFNGTDESGRSFSQRAELEQFADRGFIVVAPDSAGNGTVWPVWDAMREPADQAMPNADLSLFDELLSCVAGHVPVDQHRIYATGHSAGGSMTNYVLQRRSEILAGGIVASGVFSLTQPPQAEVLDSLFVLVTWGGDNDSYGGSAGGLTLPEFNFVEQASLASSFYEEEASVGQAHCSADLGHAWLPINDWFVDRLLEHPKGVPGLTDPNLPEPGGGVSCSSGPYALEGALEVSCGSSPMQGCQAACQLLGDCAVENLTVGPILAAELEALGFSGVDNLECGGCMQQCEAWASSDADGQVLSCFDEMAPGATCGPGIEGAQPLIDILDACCGGRADSNYCSQVCATMKANTVAATFIPTCDAF